MKTKYFILLIGIVTPVLTLFIYNRLPEEIPLHWGIDGQIDRYGEKYWAFVLSALPLFMYGLMQVIPKIDPRRDSYAKHAEAYHVIVFTIILFMAGLHWTIMFYSLGYEINITFFIKGVIGILFLVMGNYLPKIKHNYTLGIRTPWTLANENVWYKTHRVGGYGFVLLGLVWILFSMINRPYVFYVLMATLLVLVGGLFIYSYVLFAREHGKKE